MENQPWSGDANVHVSIVNWVATQDEALVPRVRRLWTRIHEPRKGAGGRGDGSRKAYELAAREVCAINSSLSDQRDVSQASVLAVNTVPQRCFTGQMIGHARFLLSDEERASVVSKDPSTVNVLFRYLNGEEFLTGGKLDRSVLDFGQRTQLEAASYAAAFKWVRTNVLPDRETNALKGADSVGNARPHHKQFLSHWWQLAFPRPELISNIEQLGRYVVCSRVTKRPIFVFVDPAIRPGDALSCFCFEDDYSYGVLQSATHWQWFLAKSSKLTERLRYSPESVFDTFPWPQSPTKKQIDAVASAAVAVRQVRAAALQQIEGGLRALYRTLELPGKNPLKDAHAALDTAVLAAYGFEEKKDLLAQLLALNLAVSQREKSGEPVTAPGVPASYGDAAGLITEDCIRP